MKAYSLETREEVEEKLKRLKRKLVFLEAEIERFKKINKVTSKRDLTLNEKIKKLGELGVNRDSIPKYNLKGHLISPLTISSYKEKVRNTKKRIALIEELKEGNDESE